jgi:diadenosine tetraphosphatase ApaH/serine/threonine PP2A family protein phosphatase
MPPVALLYDIHGNLPALRQVISDAAEQRAGEFVLGGDYALFGAWPEETVATLRALTPATWIRGNGERWTADPAAAPDNDVVQGAIGACRDALGIDLVNELANLPEQTVLEHNTVTTRYCHASPISDVRSFLPEPGDDERELLADIAEPRLVFGHTHLPFRRTSETQNPVELVNPGSVGMPFDGDPRAAYALIHEDGTVEHRRVRYDHESSAVAVQERFGLHGAGPEGDWAATVARRIASARF